MKPLNPLEWNAVPNVRGDLFQWMSESARLSFSQRSQLRSFRPGQLVFQHGDQGKEMYRIIRGILRFSSMRSDGLQMVYGLIGPGECIGSSSLIDGEPVPQTAEALGDVRVQVLSAEAFRSLRNDYREFDDALLRLLSRRMRLFSASMANNALADVPNRVALRLIEVALVGPRGTLSVPITQEALGLMSGVSRQTINKILRQFEKDGLVTLGYASIELADIDALKKLADFI